MAATLPNQCSMFFKDTKDAKSLRVGMKLFGEFVETTGILHVSPYQPSFDYSLSVYVVQKIDADSITLRKLGDGMDFSMPFEIVAQSDIYKRTPFNPAEMDMLWNKTILLFGLGSGGSKIAIELARAGIGNFILCDPDRFECANVSRHEGDLTDVGKPKVQLAAERIYKINPAVKVETFNEDIFDWDSEDIEKLFSQADIVIASTDVTAVQLMINRLTHKLKKPCVFGGCYEEALGGEVFFTLPNENMPCLECLRGGLKPPQRMGEIDYSTATSPDDYQGQPGLHAAVDFITCVEIQIALGILLRESPTSKLAKMIDPKKNFLLIGGMMGEGFYRFKKPFDIFHQPLKGPRKTCPLCQVQNETQI
jgi:molybdopterin/thiamine biosynthesis adenylyltransferase